MKIKLAILEQDKEYLKRISAVLNSKYQDRVEVYSFSNQSIALETIANNKIDFLLAADSYEIDVTQLPKRCAFAYFVSMRDTLTHKEQSAICKFQNVDLMFKQILSIYAEKTSGEFYTNTGGNACIVSAFVSASGGVGSSTVAVATAMRYAKQGLRTFYLNIEQFGQSSIYFSSEGSLTISDVVYALIGNTGNLLLKIESCVRCDKESGVYYFASPRQPLDMMELETEQIISLISAICKTGAYDRVIVDMDFTLNEKTMKVLKHVNSIVMVGDGSEISNAKTVTAYKALSILGAEEYDYGYAERLVFVYNKASNRTSREITEVSLNVLGSVEKATYSDRTELLAMIAGKSFLDNLG